MPAPPNKPFVALLCIVLGAIPISMAFGLISAKPESMHAPPYIVALAGLLFWFAAASILSGPTRPRLNHLFGGVLLAIFAAVGGWVAIFGTDSSFGGGMPFVSHATNGWIARTIFGAGAILCAALSVYALGKAARGVA